MLENCMFWSFGALPLDPIGAIHTVYSDLDL